MHQQCKVSMDRFSDLPDHVLVQIISHLPTKPAARTSLLSRRFSHLWESTPVLDLDHQALSLTTPDFLQVAHNAIHHRSSPSSLLSLRFCLNIATHRKEDPFLISFITSLISKASSLGLRHLSVQLKSKNILAGVLPCILSLNSLESLTLEDPYLLKDIPTPVNLKHLKSLYVDQKRYVFIDFINELVPQLDSLEDLHIMSNNLTAFDLKSKTLKKLEMFVTLARKSWRISTPCLEFFQLKSRLTLASIEWAWEMPMLKKAVIRLDDVSEDNVNVVFKMLSTIAHIQELHLDITECEDQLILFHTLLSHGADQPKFLKLKQLSVHICCQEFNIQDVVTIVQHSPALQVLELVHKPPFRARKDKKKELWRSMLPQNAEGNDKHYSFEDLHIVEKKEELLRKLMGKQSSKRLKTC